MSRRGSARIVNSLKSKYRQAARAGNWEFCRTIAEQLRGLDGDGAETQYALAYALEKLGEVNAARASYEIVLRINPRHTKAHARLHGLPSEPLSAHPPEQRTAKRDGQR